MDAGTNAMMTTELISNIYSLCLHEAYTCENSLFFSLITLSLPNSRVHDETFNYYGNPRAK